MCFLHVLPLQSEDVHFDIKITMYMVHYSQVRRVLESTSVRAPYLSETLSTHLGMLTILLSASTLAGYFLVVAMVGYISRWLPRLYSSPSQCGYFFTAAIWPGAKNLQLLLATKIYASRTN